MFPMENFTPFLHQNEAKIVKQGKNCEKPIHWLKYTRKRVVKSQSVFCGLMIYSSSPSANVIKLDQAIQLSD